MPYLHARTEILIGADGLAQLRATHVLVAGLGGVGGVVAEALGRAGVGRLTLLDHDQVTPSNLNRQVLALRSTLGRPKVAVMAERLGDIDPGIELTLIGDFLEAGAAETLFATHRYDAVADCIDSIACKAALVAACHRHGIAVFSALGAGNCLDVSRVRVADLNQTQVCPLARELRHRLRQLHSPLTYPVVYSDELRHPPLPHQPLDSETPGRSRAVNGTISYMPTLFGAMLAGVIIRHLLRSRGG